jgi:hypothetical protein
MNHTRFLFRGQHKQCPRKDPHAPHMVGQYHTTRS